MATLNAVNEYLHTINQSVENINQGQNYEKYTRPEMIKIIKSSALINDGHLIRYINMISDAATRIYYAKDNNSIQLGFFAFNISVDLLKQYLVQHWWQFGGDQHRSAIADLPDVAELVVNEKEN